jgi:hypothetical protein
MGDHVAGLGPIIHLAQPPKLIRHPLGGDPEPLDPKTLPTFKGGAQPPQTGYGSKAKRLSAHELNPDCVHWCLIFDGRDTYLHRITAP